jgi:hypothetical protein
MSLPKGAAPKKESKPTLTPPASEEADKQNDSGSELSDLEAESEENGDIVPDHYYDGGKIPVFKPVSQSFHFRCLEKRHVARLAWMPLAIEACLMLIAKSRW